MRADSIAGDDAQNQLDPLNIDEAEFPVAQSVSFFECRLFLRGTFEEPVDLLARLKNLNSGPGGNPVKTWVVLGLGVLQLFSLGLALTCCLPLNVLMLSFAFRDPQGDEVCPEKFAKDLVVGLEKAGVPHKANFIDAGHMAKSDGMSTALRACVDEFLAETQSSS